MARLDKQILNNTSFRFAGILVVLVCVFTLSGCGGGGGGSQVPMRPGLILDKINEIQATERANNSDDDIVIDTLQLVANQPRGGTISVQGATVSSTSQDSSSTGITGTRTAMVAGYDPDGMLNVTFARVPTTGSHQILSTTDQGATVNRVEGIPAAGWKGVEFQGEFGSRNFYGDFFSDIENNEDSDYLIMGYWIRERQERSTTRSNYGLIIAAGGNDPFVSDNLAGLAGTATYEGPATGLYMTKENADAAPAFDYFNAKASLTADFGDATTLGYISGRITEGMTDGGDALPEVTLGSADISPNSSILGKGGNYYGDTSGMTDAGIAFSGKWGGKFYSNGASATDHPGSIAGTFGAKTADDLQAITGAFGAYRQ